MRAKFVALIVTCLTAGSSCARGPVAHSMGAACNSVDDIITEAATLAGHDVPVCGYLNYRFENENLFANERAALRHDKNRCISVGLAGGFSEDLSAFNGKYVHILGKVTTDICQPGNVCLAACSDTGVYVKSVRLLE